MNYLFLIIHKIIVDILVNSVNMALLKQGNNASDMGIKKWKN